MRESALGTLTRLLEVSLLDHTTSDKPSILSKHVLEDGKDGSRDSFLQKVLTMWETH